MPARQSINIQQNSRDLKLTYFLLKRTNVKQKIRNLKKIDFFLLGLNENQNLEFILIFSFLKI